MTYVREPEREVSRVAIELMRKYWRGDNVPKTNQSQRSFLIDMRKMQEELILHHWQHMRNEDRPRGINTMHRLRANAEYLWI